MWKLFHTIFWLSYVHSTPFYYGTYRTYGTGDTVIQVAHANGGPKTAHRKWQVECLDGEAVTGISDFVFDFGGLTNVWCKFLFPYKPPATRGLYPYYPFCHVRDFTRQFFCYEPDNHTTTANTFITGFWDDDSSFWVYRERQDPVQPYKCCRTPPGYYIDYVSCYYMWSHDQYWEYYDSQYVLLQCATGYIMTGISKKKSPIVPAEYHIEWIQCCRLGFGAVTSIPPPVIPTPNGGPVAYSTGQPAVSTDIPQAYQSQYRGKRSTDVHTVIHTNKHSIITSEKPMEDDVVEFVNHYKTSNVSSQNFAQQPVINQIHGGLSRKL